MSSVRFHSSTSTFEILTTRLRRSQPTHRLLRKTTSKSIRRQNALVSLPPPSRLIPVIQPNQPSHPQKSPNLLRPLSQRRNGRLHKHLPSLPDDRDEVYSVLGDFEDRYHESYGGGGYCSYVHVLCICVEAEEGCWVC